MYSNGAVSLDSSKEPQQVKTIVESNRHLFEQNADELDEAQDLLEKQGPLEDAWALIAPESEAERLEAQVEKEHLDDEDGSEIPDLDILNKKVRKGTDFEVRQSIFTCQQIQHLLRQLNIEQKRVFYQIRQWCLDKVNGKNPHPFKVFINGGAGTGKSHLIKCLCYETNKILSPHAPNPDDIVVLITAPTATAAFNIGGTTLHQAFSLSKSLPFPYIYKRDDEINKLRTKLQNLQILIIDEISMHSVPLDSLHIFATNKEIDSHNSKMIDKVCEETETIMAQDYDRNPQTGELILRPAPYDSTHDYLPAQLLIGPNARVMLTRNIDITIGLVNGVIGTVISILPGQKGSSLPHAIKVLFDNENIGRKPITSSHSTEHIPIDITPIEESLRKNAVRYQFPLQLAWACTTHKVQGITTDKAVISMKNIFAAGMAYVALSRVKSKDGLLLQDLDEDKIYCTEQISTALQRMPKYLVEQHYDQNFKQNQLRILLHNIQGLIPHIEDLQANSDIQNVNFICLTETWMESNSVSPNLTNFNLIHKPRSSSYSSAKGIFEDLSNKKHGGVGIYVRNQQQYTQLTFESCNIECVGLRIENIKTNIVVIYRPESYTTSIFLEQLQRLLVAIPQDDGSTIVLGDFNEDILKSNSAIEMFMKQFGFMQILHNPTTDGDTLIDHVYVRGKLQISLDTIQTYYSYHNMVLLQIPVD
ncbi:unnamed protein product [Mytilus edulis]|uniref:ATP-dependent DNA helicase n=1 Tax=Mytilus edulis TaxID=6550 RepID=A0A8S3QFW3_MYTED|nr:unnamed protein product [Mytilus edulis]